MLCYSHNLIKLMYIHVIIKFSVTVIKKNNKFKLYNISFRFTVAKNLKLTYKIDLVLICFIYLFIKCFLLFSNYKKIHLLK